MRFDRMLLTKRLLHLYARLFLKNYSLKIVQCQSPDLVQRDLRKKKIYIYPD